MTLHVKHYRRRRRSQPLSEPLNRSFGPSCCLLCSLSHSCRLLCSWNSCNSRLDSAESRSKSASTVAPPRPTLSTIAARSVSPFLLSSSRKSRYAPVTDSQSATLLGGKSPASTPCWAKSDQSPPSVWRLPSSPLWPLIAPPFWLFIVHNKLFLSFLSLATLWQ